MKKGVYYYHDIQKEEVKIMKKLLVGVFSVMLVLAACGGGDDTDDNGDTGGTGEESGQEQENGDGGTEETAQAGEELYNTNCAQCHGADLTGGAGPSLENVGDDYSVDDIVDIIQNGKGQMPAQDHLSEEESQQIAEWLVNR